MIAQSTTRTPETTRLVKRRDDSVDSVEEVSRDFAPGDRGAVYRETTVRKSGHRPIRTRSSDDRYFDDRYDDRSYVSRRKHNDDYVVVDSPKRRTRDYDDRRELRLISIFAPATNPLQAAHAATHRITLPAVAVAHPQRKSAESPQPKNCWAL